MVRKKIKTSPNVVLIRWVHLRKEILTTMLKKIPGEETAQDAPPGAAKKRCSEKKISIIVLEGVDHTPGERIEPGEHVGTRRDDDGL